MLSSFSIGGITPFVEADAPHSMMLHRMRSKWSNEGRLNTQVIEDLQLELTWPHYGTFSEILGMESMPV